MFSVCFSLVLHIFIWVTEGEMFSGKDYGGTDVMCVHPVISNIAWKWLTVTRKELGNFSLLNFFFFFQKMYLNSFSSPWAKEFKCLSDHWVDTSWHFRAWCGMLMAPNDFMAPFVTSCLLYSCLSNRGETSLSHCFCLLLFWTLFSSSATEHLINIKQKPTWAVSSVTAAIYKHRLFQQ